MMKLSQVVLEKIEELQNILLQRATGTTGDYEGYERLRNELFLVPGIKEALPRFVRTCGNLSQFWDFIKSQEGVEGYAGRRSYIRKAFHPLLAGIEDDGSVGREAFFEKGSDHDAYVHIRSILQTARTDLFIIDPYMDGSIYFLLGSLSRTPLSVKILTSKVPSDFSLEGKKFVKQHSSFTLELRTTRDFHDRFVILDSAKCYLLGASIKDAGNKGFTIVPLGEISIVQFVIKYARKAWASGTPF